MLLKRSIAFSLLLVCSLIVSCSEDEPTITNAKKYGGEVTYLANGEVVSVSENAIYVVEGILDLESLFASKVQLGFTVYTGIGETSYDLKNLVSAMSYHSTYDSKMIYYYTGETPAGKITITEIDEVKKTMSGTFSGNLKKGTAEMVIADGVFTDVPYVIQDEHEKDKGSLQIAKLDGVDFKGKLHSYGTSSFTYNLSYSSGARLLEFNLPLDLQAGATYSVTNFNEAQYEGIKFVDGLYSYKATSGSVTITEFTPGQHLKGTFSFDAEAYPLARTPISFTEGTFDVTFE
ncbi:MAG TPA: DUF6252 family protein [Cyclobacteriaceae bacterium]